MNIKNLLIKYEENDKFLNSLEISKKDKIKSLILGYLLSLLIILSPIIITAHFFIYSFYFDLVVLVLALLIVLFLVLGEIFSSKLMLYFSGKEKISLKITYLVNGFIYLIMCMISYGIIILLF